MAGVEALQAFCRAGGVAEETIFALMLAFEESGANVVHHAYRGDPGRTLRVAAEDRGDVIAVEVRDDGPPFDPLAARPAGPPPDPDDPPVGGLGIELIRRSVDELRYAREGAENVLRFAKRVGRR